MSLSNPYLAQLLWNWNSTGAGGKRMSFFNTGLAEGIYLMSACVTRFLHKARLIVIQLTNTVASAAIVFLYSKRHMTQVGYHQPRYVTPLRFLKLVNIFYPYFSS